MEGREEVQGAVDVRTQWMEVGGWRWDFPMGAGSAYDYTALRIVVEKSPPHQPVQGSLVTGPHAGRQLHTMAVHYPPSPPIRFKVTGINSDVIAGEDTTLVK